MKTATAVARRWERMFKVLRLFCQTHGHADVPPNPAPDSLSRWLAEQRRRHQAGRLPVAQVRRLEALGFLLAPSRGGPDRNTAWAETRFELNFAKLAVFKKRFGHCRVPAHWSEDPGFGHWVANQRIARHQAKLLPERIERLDTLGFIWSGYLGPSAARQAGIQCVGAREELWGRWLMALARFKKQHGHCHVPPADGMGGRLYAWVVARRLEGNHGTLRADRRQRLEAIGFAWHGGRLYQEQWERRFHKLAAFKKRFGHCDVPSHWEQDRAFGHWVANQRAFRRQGKLPPERIDRLSALGFRWTARFRLKNPPPELQYLARERNELWNRRFAELVAYKKLHGHCRIPSPVPRWRVLFNWVKMQRRHARAGQLSAAHRAQLDRLGFLWQAVNPAWENKFAMLVAYQKRFGHCLMPAIWPPNRPLSNWVRHQREFKRNGTLKPEREARLNALGFEWSKDAE